MVDPVAGTGDAERGDDLVAACVVDGCGDGVEADLELAEGVGVPLRPDRRELRREAAGSVMVWSVRRSMPSRRERERAGGVEDLAECGAVRRARRRRPS